MHEKRDEKWNAVYIDIYIVYILYILCFTILFNDLLILIIQWIECNPKLSDLICFATIQSLPMIRDVCTNRLALYKPYIYIEWKVISI